MIVFGTEPRGQTGGLFPEKEVAVRLILHLRIALRCFGTGQPQAIFGIWMVDKKIRQILVNSDGHLAPIVQPCPPHC